METMAPPALKVKAIKVNDFEHIPNSYSDYQFKAKVAVQIGNAIINTHIETIRDYISGGDHVYTPTINKRDFDAISQVVNIDFSDIINQYNEFVLVEKEKIKIAAEKEEAIAFEKIGVAYDQSFIHTFEADVRKDKNKDIQASLLNTPIFTRPSKEDVQNRKANHHIQIEYRGYVVKIYKTAGGKDRLHQTIESTHIFDTILTKDGNYTGLTHNKTVKGKTVGNIYLKFVQLVNNKVASENYTQSEEQKAEAARKVYNQELKDASQEVVFVESETKYETDYRNASRRRTNYDKPYKVYTFFIKVGETKYALAMNQREGVKTYSIKGISGLSAEQLRAIIAIVKELK